MTFTVLSALLVATELVIAMTSVFLVYQFGKKSRNSVVLAFGETRLQGNIGSLDITKSTKPLSEGLENRKGTPLGRNKPYLHGFWHCLRHRGHK